MVSGLLYVGILRLGGGRGYDVSASTLGGGGIIGLWLVGYCTLGCKTWEKGRGWLV